MDEILFDSSGTSRGTSAWMMFQLLLWRLLLHEVDLSLLVNTYTILRALRPKTSPLGLFVLLAQQTISATLFECRFPLTLPACLLWLSLLVPL
jgi:hypothetical protein